MIERNTMSTLEQWARRRAGKPRFAKREGLVPVEITVTNSKGTTFKKTVMKRPAEAKKMVKEGKGRVMDAGPKHIETSQTSQNPKPKQRLPIRPTTSDVASPSASLMKAAEAGDHDAVIDEAKKMVKESGFTEVEHSVAGVLYDKLANEAWKQVGEAKKNGTANPEADALYDAYLWLGAEHRKESKRLGAEEIAREHEDARKNGRAKKSFRPSK